MPKTIISDTSCFIVLSKIGQMELLKELFGAVITTPEIAAEFAETLPEWVKIVSVQDKQKQQLFEFQVDNGEASAMALALEVENALVIIDDYKARKLAKNLNINYTGTIGLIISAKRKGIISDVKPLLEKIKETNFRLLDELYRKTLELAEE
jgi:predicted nucleic acid-binding protein